MRALTIVNPNLSDLQYTYLDSDYTDTSGTALTVRSNVSFQADDYLVIGAIGSEEAELQRISSISGKTTINLAAGLGFTHQKGSPIYLAPWDTVEISRAVSGGSWAVISDSAIQWDKVNTVYVDNNGVSGDSYRWRFRHSARGIYSEYSPTVTGAGFGRNTVGYMLARVRSIIGDKERKIVDNSEILRFLNKAQDIIYGIRPDWWFLKVDTEKGANGIAATVSTDTYSLSTYSDLAYLDRVKYKFSSGDTTITYNLEYLTPVLFDEKVRDNNAAEDNNAEAYTVLPADSSSDQGYLRIYPKTDTTGVGTIYPIYYKKMTDLAGVASETDVPIPSVLEDFAISMCFRIMGNETKAKLYERLFLGPSPKDKDRESSRDMSGVSLLEQLHANSGKPVGQPRSIWSFKGRQAMSKLYGDRTVNRDDLKERYF